MTKDSLEILDKREKECEDHLALLDEMERTDRIVGKIAGITTTCALIFMGIIGLLCWLGLTSF